METLSVELRRQERDKLPGGEQTPVADTIEKIARKVLFSTIDTDSKSIYLDSLSHLDDALLENAYRNSEGKITPLDMKYIICFNAGMSVRDISILFNIEPASVTTVRYRIRKKFAKEDSFRTII